MIVYIVCLAVGLLFTFISAIAGHFFDHDHGGDVGTGGHAEAGYDHTGLPGISFFSPTVLASFVTAFGAFGILFTKIDATHNVWVSAPLSAVCAMIVAWLVLLVFNYMFSKTQSSSESRVITLVGHTASVITPIPANGVGEIAYVQSTTRYTSAARAERGEAIPAGAVVKITRVGTQFFVDTIKEN